MSKENSIHTQLIPLLNFVTLTYALLPLLRCLLISPQLHNGLFPPSTTWVIKWLWDNKYASHGWLQGSSYTNRDESLVRSGTPSHGIPLKRMPSSAYQILGKSDSPLDSSLDGQHDEFKLKCTADMIALWHEIFQWLPILIRIRTKCLKQANAVDSLGQAEPKLTS